MSVLLIDSDKVRGVRVAHECRPPANSRPDLLQEGADGGTMLRRGVSGLPLVNALPAVGANVYDIARHDYLVITEPALNALVERLTRPINRAFKPLGYEWRAWVAQQEVKAAERARRAAAFPEWLERAKALRAQRSSSPASDE